MLYHVTVRSSLCVKRTCFPALSALAKKTWHASRHGGCTFYTLLFLEYHTSMQMPVAWRRASARTRYRRRRRCERTNVSPTTTLTRTAGPECDASTAHIRYSRRTPSQSAQPFPRPSLALSYPQLLLKKTHTHKTPLSPQGQHGLFRDLRPQMRHLDRLADALSVHLARPRAQDRLHAEHPILSTRLDLVV